VVEKTENGYAATFKGSRSAAEYLVTSSSRVLTPGMEAVASGGVATVSDNDLLIISHRNFMESLEPLVRARVREGLAVEVVDVDDVYALYNRGMVDPEAIRSFIADSVRRGGTRYVLLVGGDTFDYLDHLEIESVSFIPSIYAATDSYITHAPVDPLYGDIDNDSVPDVAVGRFPVRTRSEAEHLVAKTLDYERHADQVSAVIAADAYDTAQNLHFSGFAERFAAHLPSKWDLTRAYVDTFDFDGARETLIQAINDGSALTSYVGHSGPTMWSFDGLLHVDDVAGLTNYDRPTVAVQWGCWNTYFVEPRYESIGTALLLSGGQGAAAVLGSTTLSWVDSSHAFSDLFAPVMVSPGVRLGDAIIEAKRRLARQKPDATDVILGWTLLGDPTLILNRE
jgi:hypothetical protein